MIIRIPVPSSAIVPLLRFAAGPVPRAAVRPMLSAAIAPRVSDAVAALRREEARAALPGVILIGVVSGLRSQLGPAAVALTTDPAERRQPAALLAGPWAAAGTAAAAAGEMIGDKLPRTPSRLSPAGLLPRLAFGAFAAAALNSRRHDGLPLAVAASVGAAAALGGSYAGARWRRAVRDRGRPDWPAAVAEDACAVALAYAAVRI